MEENEVVETIVFAVKELLSKGHTELERFAGDPYCNGYLDALEEILEKIEEIKSE